MIANKLSQIVRENQLERFYPPERLNTVIQRVNRTNFQSLAAQWDLPLSIAIDLAPLALYDVVIYGDDSGSMAAEERGARIDDLKLIVGRVCDVTTLFDDDGIQIRFMNAPQAGNGIRNSGDAATFIQGIRFNGMTPLATQLELKVLHPLVYQPIQARQLQKPVLIITITDGEPLGEPREKIKHVIRNARQWITQVGYPPSTVAFQFAQVGSDMKAQAFLAELDQDPVVGKMIDCTSYYELEASEYQRKGIELKPQVYLVKLMVGAIDRSYDEGDES